MILHIFEEGEEGPFAGALLLRPAVLSRILEWVKTVAPMHVPNADYSVINILMITVS